MQGRGYRRLVPLVLELTYTVPLALRDVIGLGLTQAKRCVLLRPARLAIDHQP